MAARQFNLLSKKKDFFFVFQIIKINGLSVLSVLPCFFFTALPKYGKITLWDRPVNTCFFYMQK